MNESFLYQALNSIAETVVIVDTSFRIQFSNRRFLEQMQTRPEDLPDAVLPSLCDTELTEELLVCLERAKTGSAGDFVGRSVLNRHDATEHITCTPIYADDTDEGASSSVDAIIVIARDTERIHNPNPNAQRLEFQDPVTGLLNRRSIKIVTERELQRADRGTPNLAMLFIMLRNFKQINQMHGHTVGDLLLENTGVRVRETIRKSDYVFRWEGTNLVVLLPELATPLDALVVAEKIQSGVTVPYRFRNLDLAPECFIGISLYPTDATDVDGLFNCANSAVIEAERREQPVLHFDPDTHQAASDRLYLRTGLQRAFERGELEIYYQPIVDTKGKICGAEALIRWNHPERGVLGPVDFIGIAEDSRLIVPIDKLALYHAARSVVEWNREHDLFVTLNISAINIADSSLPVVVDQAIRDAGLSDISRLKLELTESKTIENRQYSQAAMDELKEMGVDIWIDDFGTGQSSLSYLKHLPVSTVKIDREFMAELGTAKTDTDYLEGIVNTIRSRGKRIVVEGVSDESQYKLLRKLPIDFMQGFYFAKPMPAAEFEKLIKNNTVLPHG